MVLYGLLQTEGDVDCLVYSDDKKNVDKCAFNFYILSFTLYVFYCDSSYHLGTFPNRQFGEEEKFLINSQNILVLLWKHIWYI